MTKHVRNIVGNVPEPEELYGRYGRDDLIQHLWRQIRGNNILLLAPRRFGKTGVMRVEPIHRDAAVELIKDLAHAMDVGLSDPVVERILNLTTPHVPYFIHLMFSQLGQLPAQHRAPLTVAVLDEVYRRRVLGPSCTHYFDHYRTRLARYGKPLERSAIAVLTAVAEAPHGRVGASALYGTYQATRGRGASEQEFDELLADLECDWYLTLDPRTNEYFFMVGVMRDWWRRWFGTARRRRSEEA